MNTKHVLAESKNYRVSCEYETVFLLRKPRLFSTSLSEICIGDFYGDPRDAVIDRAERFVIIAGYGLIIYRLVEPFAPYSYGMKNGQWSELLRDAPDAWWIENIVQTADDIFVFQVNARSPEAGNYQLTWPTLIVEKR